MKLILSILIIFSFTSCTKSLDDGAAKGVSLSQRGITTQAIYSYPQIARLSFWLLFTNENNYWENRCDFSEVLMSDNFSNSITKEDSIKTVDGSDNMGIKSSLTSKLILKEYRQYPVISDTVHLKIWNFTRDHYVLKFNGNNFPILISAYLYDRTLKTKTALPTMGNYTTFIPIDINADEHRFSIIFERIYLP